jgi:hypothetical protein
MGRASGCGDLARVGVRRKVAGDGAAYADGLLLGVRNTSELDQDLDPGLGLLAGQFGLCFGLCLGDGDVDHDIQLTGEDGNACAIIGRVRRALQDTGVRRKRNWPMQLAPAASMD